VIVGKSKFEAVDFTKNVFINMSVDIQFYTVYNFKYLLNLLVLLCVMVSICFTYSICVAFFACILMVYSKHFTSMFVYNFSGIEANSLHVFCKCVQNLLSNHSSLSTTHWSQ